MINHEKFKKNLRSAYSAMASYPQWRNQLSSELLQVIEHIQESSLTLRALQVASRGPQSTSFNKDFETLNKRIKEATQLCGLEPGQAELLYLNFLYACLGLNESDESKLLLIKEWEKASEAFPNVHNLYQEQIKN